MPLLRLLRYTKSYRPQYLRATAWSVLNKLFDIAPEILIGVAIDVVVKREQSWIARLGITEVSEQLIALSILTFFIWFFESFFEFLHMMEWRTLAQRIQHDLRMDAFRHVLRLDLQYFENQKSGNLVAIMNDDCNQLERFLDGGANDLIQTFTVAIVIGGIFFYIAPSVAVWATLPIPVILLGAFYYKDKAEPLYSEVRSKAGALAARLTSSIAGMMTIKSQTAESFEARRLEGESRDYMAANQGAIRVSSAFTPIIRMAVLAGFLATLVVGGFQALDGRLEVGSFGVLVFLTQRLLWPMTRIAQTFDLYQRGMASVRRILDLLDQRIEVTSGKEPLARELAQNSIIRFDNISFSYATRPHVLSNVSFVIKPGTMVALVGATGSGKSTISKLLLRFYDPSAGKICIGDRDLSSFRTTDIRKMIGYVGQDHFMFDGSVRDNILYGHDGGVQSDEAVIEAARAAEALEFCEKLPEGLDTLIGERGQKLSGGQKQRLAIARAIVRQPPILILDEATSAVDNETERLIQKSIQRLAVGRSLLVIAHRLSTIRRADAIYVLDQGAIVEAGTHDELLARKGLYANLWSIQTGS